MKMVHVQEEKDKTLLAQETISLTSYEAWPSTSGDKQMESTSADKDEVSPEADVGGIKSEIDGGWGWMVVAGCSLMHFLLGGWARSYGIFYIRMREHFQSSAAVTAWVGGVSTAVRMGFSPVANALARRFSVKSVAFVGGILLSLGICIAGFGPNIEFMFFPIGVVAGLGGTLIYSPAIVHVGQYFDKKRGIATGIASAGSGFGVFAFPPLAHYLFLQFGFTGTFLIFGALMANACVSAMVYRPLSPSTLKEINTTKGKKGSGTQETKELEGMRKYLDYKLLGDFTFLSFAIALGLVTNSYISSQMLVPAHAVQCGVGETWSSILLSILGISDTIGRLVSGIIFDFPRVRPHRLHLYNLCILLTAGTIFGWGFSRSLQSLMLFCILHGLINGCVVSQRAVVVADVMGIDKLSSSFGLTVFCQGVGAMIGPMLAGLLRDLTGTYQASFMFTGSACTLAFFILYAGHFYTIRKNKKNATKDMSS